MKYVLLLRLALTMDYRILVFSFIMVLNLFLKMVKFSQKFIFRVPDLIALSRSMAKHSIKKFLDLQDTRSF